jgi:hypothetical protein
MSLDRKFLDYMKASGPREYAQLRIGLRIALPIIVGLTAFLIAAEAIEFRSRNILDANAYPLGKFVAHEVVLVLLILVAARFWFLVMQKER